MKTWLLNRWDALRTNFWFVPTVMVWMAVVLSFVAISLDDMLGANNWFATLGWTVSRGPEGSRQLLAAVAGTEITIASLTFSITIVALQLASSQFGPRLLRNFMRDAGNQVTLGTFIATFTYCLLVLRTVNGSEDNTHVPHIAVTIGVLLALLSLGILIYFIHHAAESIQAENVIASVSRDLQETIGWLFPEKLGQEPPDRSHWVSGGLPEDFDSFSKPVPASMGGYVQGIDDQALLDTALEHDLVLRVMKRPGKFVVHGGTLVEAWPIERVNDQVIDRLKTAFYLGHRRTLTQDVEFAIDQLVEVALRALSPGINDPFTAITCVDHLGAALVELADRRLPSPYRHDDTGRLRVATNASTPDGLVDAAFHQIRQAARSNAAVSLRLLEVIADAGRQILEPSFRAALWRHAQLIARGAQESLPDPSDQAEATERLERVRKVLKPRLLNDSESSDNGQAIPSREPSTSAVGSQAG